MNDSQSNRLDMYIVVKGFYNDNQAIIDTVPARAIAFGQLQNNITAINSQIAGQSSNTTGVTLDKAAIRANLDNIASSILTPAKAWAISVNNNTLTAEFDYSLSAIQGIKDDTMQGFCDHRIPLINNNLPALSDFGILPTDVAAWQDALNDYVAVLESPREAINTKHLHTKNLKTLFSETFVLFRDQIDPLMYIFKTSNPEIYDAYNQAKIIIDRRGPRKSTIPEDAIRIGLYAFDIETLQPVKGATLRILNAPDGEIYQATTNEEGILTITVSGYTPNVSALVQAEIIADGYEPTYGDEQMLPGKLYSVEVELNPVVLPPPPDPVP